MTPYSSVLSTHINRQVCKLMQSQCWEAEEGGWPSYWGSPAAVRDPVSGTFAQKGPTLTQNSDVDILESLAIAEQEPCIFSFHGALQLMQPPPGQAHLILSRL